MDETPNQGQGNEGTPGTAPGAAASGATPPIRRSRFRRFLSFLGIDTTREKKLHVHLRPRFFKGAVGTVVFLIAASVGLVEYSTNPRFCDSCHIMTPYYNAWKTSKHKKVACVKCHYPPDKKGTIWLKFQASAQIVKYITRTYSSKPYAEIQDASCLRSGCHSKRLLKGKVIFKRGIVFDHRPHLLDMRRGKKLRCTSCHSQIVIGTHVEVTETTCFICHFKGMKKGRELEPIGGCPSCHKPSDKDFKIGNITYNHKDFVGQYGVKCQNCHLEIVQGEGNAPKERCFSCHNQPERLAKYTDTTFLHDNHITKHGIECTQCHLEITHKVQTGFKTLQYDCSICHISKHGGQKELYQGVGGKGVPPMPSPMYLAGVDCIGCHIVKKDTEEVAHFKGQTFEPSKEGCVKCHGKSYVGLLNVWKTSMAGALDKLTPKLAKTKQLLGKSGKASPEIRKLVADAEYNIDFVSISRGAHNIYYASRLLEVADDWLDQARSKLGAQPVTLKSNRVLNGTYCATMCHSEVGVKIPTEVTVNGEKLPHANHGIKWGVACTNCHAIENHKHLKTNLTTTKDCLGCHHKNKNADCKECHSETARFFDGPPANPMASLACTDCHDLSQKHSAGAVAGKCESCHSAEYRGTLKNWQAETNARLAEVSRLIRTCEKKKLAPDSLAVLNEARKQYLLVSKVKGVHNPEYALELLDGAKQKLSVIAGR